jgi:signal transduction histidine kinase
MFGDRDDPYRALTRLGARLESMLDPMEAPAIIVRAIAESLRVPWVAIRLRRLDDAEAEATDSPDIAARRVISHGRQPTSELVSMPLVSGTEVVGELQVAPRSPSEPLSLADRALLGALARQATPALRAVSLTLDLVESRERLVVAREEERRRIRRDLHDGLGPTLAAVGMRAEVAADLAARDPAAAQRLLDEMRSEVRAALADVRRLVDALRPPALDELGLVGALQAQASRLGVAPAIEVDAASLPALPAAVEVAAYRIAVEAMTNAARHAAARSCRVLLHESEADGSAGPVLEIEIADDGRGIPDPVRPGIGLTSMRERAAEIGGSLTVARGPSGGTLVTARLPLTAPAGPA